MQSIPHLLLFFVGIVVVLAELLKTGNTFDKVIKIFVVLVGVTCLGFVSPDVERLNLWIVGLSFPFSYSSGDLILLVSLIALTSSAKTWSIHRVLMLTAFTILVGLEGPALKLLLLVFICLTDSVFDKAIRKPYLTICAIGLFFISLSSGSLANLSFGQVPGWNAEGIEQFMIFVVGLVIMLPMVAVAHNQRKIEENVVTFIVVLCVAQTFAQEQLGNELSHLILCSLQLILLFQLYYSTSRIKPSTFDDTIDISPLFFSAPVLFYYTPYELVALLLLVLSLYLYGKDSIVSIVEDYTGKSKLSSMQIFSVPGTLIYAILILAFAGVEGEGLGINLILLLIMCGWLIFSGAKNFSSSRRYWAIAIQEKFKTKEIVIPFVLMMIFATPLVLLGPIGNVASLHKTTLTAYLSVTFVTIIWVVASAKFAWLCLDGLPNKDLPTRASQPLWPRQLIAFLGNTVTNSRALFSNFALRLTNSINSLCVNLWELGTYRITHKSSGAVKISALVIILLFFYLVVLEGHET
jgi:hypothetical protein